MIKTQVQIPDELYHKAKAVAAAKEWSLAEVFRRGLEYMTTVNPVEESNPEWDLPVLEESYFSKDFDALDFRKIVAEEEVRAL